MGTLTIRLPDDKHSRLKALAKHKKISVNKLIADFDAETRFRAMAAKGSGERGLELLALLDDRLSTG